MKEKRCVILGPHGSPEEWTLSCANEGASNVLEETGGSQGWKAVSSLCGIQLETAWHV